MAKNREKLLTLLEMKESKTRSIRQKVEKLNNKNPVKESIKLKKLNAHFYKNLFKISRKKMKVSNDSCPGSRHKKQRSCCGQGCRKSFHQSCTENKIESGSTELSAFKFGVSTEIHNHALPYVKKLHDYWNRGQNALLFDGQDRTLKVVLFILSLLDNVRKPVLIIAASGALSIWETVFSKQSKLVNVVTYKGNKDARVAIRESKFYRENGSTMFQVLLCSPDVIVEDLEVLEQIKWELLVIDECQRPIISTHLAKIKMLVAHMKLLTVTDETVDISWQSYRNILSLLDCKNEEMHNTHADMYTNDNIRTLKERLSPFIAFRCKFNTLKFEEFWVPVHLSSMQIEQYCLILFSNLESLSSCLRRNSSLHDVLTQTQKCCDHPYLVDPTLRKSFKREASIDPLSAEINVSGKLQLLDKILLEIKQCGLRVLVLFQSAVSSEKISTGHFLDDLVHQRYGQDSYVHIPGKLLSNSARAKKKESLKLFNSVDNEAFICLCDYCACHSSIRLSRVDVVILFNSDWNPSNDIKALQRITIESDSEQIRVLRLYSTFTVEEKALILSKQGTPCDNHITSSVCHKLLAWGAYYLFTRLQKGSHKPPSFIDDSVGELSSVFRNTGGKTSPTNYSIILNAQLRNGAYSGGILLLGEAEAHMKESCLDEKYLMENGPFVFWSKLVKESQYRPKGSCNRLSRRVQNSSQNTCHWFESENRNAAANFFFVRTKLRSKRKVHDKFGKRKRAGGHAYVSGHQSSGMSPTMSQGDIQRESQSTCISDSVALDSRTNGVQQSQNSQSQDNSSSTPLDIEIERIRKEQEQVTKLHQEKKSMLLSECEREISKVRKKYDALIEESEMSLTNQMKNLDKYYELVNANKLLAEFLAQNCEDTLNLKRTRKETSSLGILEIPASAQTQPENPNVPPTFLSLHNLGGSEQWPPPLHPRTNPSFSLSFQDQPTTHETFLDPLTTHSTSQTLSCIQTESNKHVYQVIKDLPDLPELPMEFDRFYDMGCPSLPFLG